MKSQSSQLDGENDQEKIDQNLLKSAMSMTTNQTQVRQEASIQMKQPLVGFGKIPSQLMEASKKCLSQAPLNRIKRSRTHANKVEKAQTNYKKKQKPDKTKKISKLKKKSNSCYTSGIRKKLSRINLRVLQSQLQITKSDQLSEKINQIIQSAKQKQENPQTKKRNKKDSCSISDLSTIIYNQQAIKILKNSKYLDRQIKQALERTKDSKRKQKQRQIFQSFKSFVNGLIRKYEFQQSFKKPTQSSRLRKQIKKIQQQKQKRKLKENLKIIPEHKPDPTSIIPFKQTNLVEQIFNENQQQKNQNQQQIFLNQEKKSYSQNQIEESQLQNALRNTPSISLSPSESFFLNTYNDRQNNQNSLEEAVQSYENHSQQQQIFQQNDFLFLEQPSQNHSTHDSYNNALL